MSVGKKIRKLLKERRISPVELADHLGISRANMYFILNDKVTLSFERAVRIAKFLNVDLDELLPEEEEVPGEEPIFARGVDPKLLKLIRKEVDQIIEKWLEEEENKKRG